MDNWKEKLLNVVCAGDGMEEMHAQGATEYLVLLAVVLIVALVSVALLGFFPGMASDAQLTQSQMYWKSAGPIAVTESVAKAYSSDMTINMVYLRLRNSGAYPVRITKLWGGGSGISQVFIGTYANISEYYYLAPGEETYVGGQGYGFPELPANRLVDFTANTYCSSPHVLCKCMSICSSQSGNGYGTLVLNDFGFEYIEYIEGQQITKKQIGKPLIVKCSPPT